MELCARLAVDAANFSSPAPSRPRMHFGYAHMQPIVSIIAGVLILLVPRLLNYIVAIYLIVVGLIGLGVIR
jgi:predicted Co/Zn/Cd cation transporter (cation efflux family)